MAKNALHLCSVIVANEINTATKTNTSLSCQKHQQKERKPLLKEKARAKAQKQRANYSVIFVPDRQVPRKGRACFIFIRSTHEHER